MTAEPILLKIRTTQMVPGDPPEIMELQSEGTMTRYDDRVELSYIETEMTGLEGVATTFTAYTDGTVVLTREGEKLRSRMRFSLNEKDDSLYDIGFGALLLTVTARRIQIDWVRHTLEVEYGVEVEHSPMGTNIYHVEYRPL